MPQPSADPQSVFKKFSERRYFMYLKRHPLLVDWLLISPLLIIGVLAMFIEPSAMHGKTREWDVLGVVLMLAIVVPVAWRRRAPRLVLAINIVATVPFLVMNYADNGVGLASLVALYTVAAHCDRRDALIALGWTSAIIVPVLVAGVFYEGEQLPIGSLVSNIVIFGTAWLVGDSVRNRRILVEELRFRAETAEHQKEEDARQAMLDERARIAREMHDIVAHGMSVMIVQAGAARRILDKRPDQAAEAMANIEQTGRDAMVEMRRLLGVMRAGGLDSDPTADSATGSSALAPGERSTASAGREPAPLAPQPGLKAVPGLVQQWVNAGLDVQYEVEGDVPELAPGLDVSAYRLIQEALTNTSKHAGPARAIVTIRVTDSALDITVADDGYGAAAAPGTGTGHGLIGMQERVSLFGGSLTAAPGKSGGFVVHAVLPLDASATPPAVGASTP